MFTEPRAAASLASDRAGLDAAGMPRPSLFDQLLESRDLPSSRPSPPGPATTTGPSPQSRPSPRRKGGAADAVVGRGRLLFRVEGEGGCFEWKKVDLQMLVILYFAA